MKLENAKLLIVDDEVDLCQVLSWDFEDQGMEVTLTHGGHKAIELIKKNNYDIILSDIKMPDGDGIELLEYIYNERVPIRAVYLMTGYSDYPIKKLLEKGMRKLYKKPVETEVIIEDMKNID